MSIRRKIGGTSGGRRSHGVTRIERSAQARRQRAMHHLKRVRNRREAPLLPSLGIASVGLALIALVAGTWIGASWALDAELEHVSVQGLRHLSSADVVAASGLVAGTTLETVDPAELATQLETHPWIEHARALRLPSGLVLIGVREREAAATLVGTETWAIDANGTPFDRVSSESLEGLPRIVTRERFEPGVAHGSLAEAVSLPRQLADHGLPAAVEIGITASDDPEGLWLRLPDIAARIVLGRGQLDEKLDRLARVLDAELPELARATRIDLRFSDQAVLDVPQSQSWTAPQSQSWTADSRFPRPHVVAAQVAASRGHGLPSITAPAG